MIFKTSSAQGRIHDMTLIGDVEGKKCIIMDDMADTCGTLCTAANVILNNGGISVEAYCTHAVLSGGAEDKLYNSNIDKLYVTDTIDNKSIKRCPRIEVLSIAPLFAEAIKGIHEENSLKYLFDY